MAEVRYVLVDCYGKRRDHIEKIKSCVKNMSLGMRIPMVKFEPGDGKQFYLGLAVYLEDPSVTRPTPELERLFSCAGLKRPIEHPPNRNIFFHPNEISKGFLSGNVQWESFNESITFESLQEDLAGVEPQPNPLGETQGIGADAMNKLLWWGSAMGRGSYNLFRQACARINGNSDTPAWHLMRRLNLLGHLEFDNEDGPPHWGIVGTAFILSKAGDAFLIGRRTPGLINSLQQRIDLSTKPMNQSPDRIGARIADLHENMGFLADMGVALLEDTVQDWLDLLPEQAAFFSHFASDPDIQQHNYTFARWTNSGFIQESFDGRTRGLYEITSIGRGGPSRHVCFDGQRWVKGGFYDLKWLSRKVTVAEMQALHYPDGRLVVPMEERWPLLYERALVLCSGSPPSKLKSRDGEFLSYQAIPLKVASSLCEKLELQLKRWGTQ